MLSIDELQREQPDFICPYFKECLAEKYNSCYNHSHVLCEDFRDFYENTLAIKRAWEEAEY